MTIPGNNNWTDPIVEEVRDIRERILQESGGTLEGLIARLRAQEASRRNVVRLEKGKRASETDVA
jgi:hypothetical protein